MSTNQSRTALSVSMSVASLHKWGQFTVSPLSDFFFAASAREEHHNVTSFLDGRRAATETLLGEEPGRRRRAARHAVATELLDTTQPPSSVDSIWIVISSIVVNSIGGKANSWLIGDI